MKRFNGIINSCRAFCMVAILLANLVVTNIPVKAANVNEGTTKEEQESTLNESTEDTKLLTNEEVAEENTQSSATDTSSGSLNSDSVAITAKAAVLMEGSTGELIYAKNKDDRLNPASITKIMTLILIFEAIDSGKISLTDTVSVSEHAASMGGSQVYLEPYETQTVDTMIKCISICSANDACVAMSEYVAGSETEFVAMMNEKAKSLGMDNTNFVNCCGLDVTNHYSTAYDVALMSRELIINHPEISNYCTVWMDTITHTTRKGTSEFGLTNTNKLIKTYNGITGLKTGSTSLAKYCLSATARRDSMDMIAVVMAAPETKTRFAEAAKLLDYGFANCTMYTDDHSDLIMDPVDISRGVEDTVSYQPEKKFNYVCMKDQDPQSITREISYLEEIKAPIQAGDKVGEIKYYYNGELIGTVDLVSDQTIAMAKFHDYLKEVLEKFFMN